MSYGEDRTNCQGLQLPPGWLKCPRRGQIIAGKFIPFKTPLDDNYRPQIPPSDLFSPEMFISLVSSCDKVKLGLWIDLTFTTRFYDKSIVEKKGINYCKFQCRGHDECPTKEQTQLFANCCANYITKNPLDVIGVHCTHGYNRTGFLICAFLVEKYDWSVEAAVNAFAKARPPGIYKDSYIKELFRRYGDVEDAPPAPQKPEWCFELKFMASVSGVTTVADPDKIREVQQICQRMCNSKMRCFPGSQLPDGWLKCPKRGQIISGKFIPFKTPLDDNYRHQIPPSDLFSPEMFISLVSSCDKVKLGLWIDLTFTTRFYDKSIVEKKGINYCKFQCRGHECPTKEQTQLFVNCCANYISKNPLDVIGVHCTHGYNRTGFLICAFLVEKYDWSVEAAVNAFAKARPPGIYRDSYIKELFRRYGYVEDAPPAPQKPEWCLETDDLTVDDDGIRHNNNRQSFYKTSKFMDGVSGVTTVADSDKIREVQLKCQRMCKYKMRGFPGSQPVSMDTRNIQLLADREYMVSWKADGTRYMLLINGEDDCYFVDRDNTVFKLDSVIKFFKRNGFPRHLENTLLDGEMIVDVVNNQKIARYLIYDIISFENQEVGEVDFKRRILCIDKEVIGPRERAKLNNIIDRSREPFGIRKKDFWELRDTYKIFGDNFKRHLSHEIDGLIFKPVPDPYIAGQCDVILKWKPPSHNSVDFRLKIVIEDRPGFNRMLRRMVGQLFVGGHDRPFDEIKVTKELRQYENKIIECTYDMNSRQWVFMRERTDKSFTSSVKTAKAVFESIKNPVTQEILLQFIETRGYVTRSVKRPMDGPDSGLMPLSKLTRI